MDLTAWGEVLQRRRGTEGKREDLQTLLLSFPKSRVEDSRWEGKFSVLASIQGRERFCQRIPFSISSTGRRVTEEGVSFYENFCFVL